MVKPQFEVGRERLGSGGVVRVPSLWVDAVVGVARRGRRAGTGRPGRRAQPAAGSERQRRVLRVAAPAGHGRHTQCGRRRAHPRRRACRGGRMSRRALVVTHGGREEAVAATRDAVAALERAGVEPVLARRGRGSRGPAVVRAGDRARRRRDDPARGRAHAGHVGAAARGEPGARRVPRGERAGRHRRGRAPAHGGRVRRRGARHARRPGHDGATAR